MTIKITTRDIQIKQLEIFKELIQFFKDNDLTYFAIFGTALGAYRHKGFIPWDDDIDIAMPRKDYDKLVKMQGNLPGHLFIQHPLTDRYYPLYLTKIRLNDTIFKEKRLKDYNMHHGIYIDIFPFDNLPSGYEEYKKRYRKIRSLEEKLRRVVKKNNKNIIYKLKYFFHNLYAGFRTKEQLFTKLDNLHKLVKKESKYIGNYTNNKYLKKEVIYPLRECLFEGLIINIPNKIDEYLEGEYGESYMELPLEKDRKHHNPLEINF